eukprot:1183952-Prorocentrum_minimum.AAC.2
MSVWLLGEAKSHGVPTDVELGLSSAFSGEENNTAGDGSLEMRSLSESSTLHTDVALPEFVASPSSITASNRATLCRRKWFSSSFALCCASNSSLFFCNCAICSRSVRVAVPAAPGTGTPSAGSSVGPSELPDRGFPAKPCSDEIGDGLTYTGRATLPGEMSTSLPGGLSGSVPFAGRC